MNQTQNGSKRERRHFTGQQKVSIAKAYLVDGVPISQLCDQRQIQPTQFYLWEKQLFENGEAAFQRKVVGKSPERRQIEQLQAKLVNKNEMIAELMEENVKAKKNVGNSKRTVGSSRRARGDRRAVVRRTSFADADFFGDRRPRRGSDC